MKLKVVTHRAKEGGYWAEVPALPGCYSQGETAEEVLANIVEAIKDWVAVASKRAKGKGKGAAKVQEIEV
jgi:predicted RNase H-like HicB family nuclease